MMDNRQTLKRVLFLLVRVLLAVMAMFVAYMLSTTVMGDTNIVMTPEESRQAGRALVLVSFVSALLLSVLILRSGWSGLRLVGALIVIVFGIETFMTQIETLYFNSAVQMETVAVLGIVAAGGVRALVFAPLAVFIFGKMRNPERPAETNSQMARTGWGKRIASLAVIYVVVYFVFGYFVAWQWEEVRLFYSGTAEIKPFLSHFWDLFVKEDPLIVPFQIVRGALWATLAFVIAGMMKSPQWEVALAVAFAFAVLVALPIGVFPNPYMPPEVRQAHFVELSTSMLLFGAIAGWALHQKGSSSVSNSRRVSAASNA